MDTFTVGVYPVNAPFAHSEQPTETATLADLDELERVYAAKFEPAALEVEPDPSELSLDIMQLEEDEAAFVMRSHDWVDPDQVRPGGGLRSRFRFMVWAGPDEYDPSHPVTVSGRSGRVDPAATVEFRCGVENAPYTPGG